MSFCPFPTDGDGRESSGDAAALRMARETAASREAERFPEDPQAPTGEAHGEPGPAMYAKLRAMALQQAKRDQDLGTRETRVKEREERARAARLALERRERVATAVLLCLCDWWRGWCCAFLLIGLTELFCGGIIALAVRWWGTHR